MHSILSRLPPIPLLGIQTLGFVVMKTQAPGIGCDRFDYTNITLCHTIHFKETMLCQKTWGNYSFGYISLCLYVYRYIFYCALRHNKNDLTVSLDVEK